MTAANKIGNNFADIAEVMLPGASKTVWQAIALSFAQRLVGETLGPEVQQELAEEWDALHSNGIVPQRRRAK